MKIFMMAIIALAILLGSILLAIPSEILAQLGIENAFEMRLIDLGIIIALSFSFIKFGQELDDNL
jgi:hypothetical protein